MLISEMEAQLKELREKHGDLYVKIRYDEGYYMEPRLEIERFLLGFVKPFLAVTHGLHD